LLVTCQSLLQSLSCPSLVSLPCSRSLDACSSTPSRLYHETQSHLIGPGCCRCLGSPYPPCWKPYCGKPD
ncbi:hypothetical protein BGW39_004789, partial [Mortierella sp. 14UC]